MKKIIITTILCFFLQLTFAQQNYEVNGENLELTTIVEGDVDLFYTITNRSYRYFVRTKNDTFFELKNEKLADGFSKEYISVLREVAPNSEISAEKVKLTTGSLKRYIDSHNKSSNINYNVKDNNLKVNFRLGIFGGITNHPLVEYLDDNGSYPQLAAELELFGDTDDPMHSGLLQVRNTFASADDYKSLEFSLGYRFRFVRKSGFNLYAQTRFATVNSFSVNIIDTNPANNSEDISRNETEFDVPFIFGIGTDIKISDHSYISILYDRFYAFGLDNNSNFPTDIMIGYKFKL